MQRKLKVGGGESLFSVNRDRCDGAKSSRIWWWTAIFLGVCFVLQLFFYEESKYIPRLPSTRTDATLEPKPIETDGKSDTKADSLNKTVTQNTVHSMGYTKKTIRERLAWYTPTPGGTQGYFSIIWECVVLLRFPAVAYTSIIYGSSLAWFSVVLNTLSTYFTLPPYNFGPAAIGLMNLPPFIGTLIALVIASSNDWIILQLAKRNGGVFEPEMRLWLGLLGVVAAPAGMLMYGLTLAKGVAWIVPAIGLGIFGFGFGIVSDVSLTYLQDCYTGEDSSFSDETTIANNEQRLWVEHSFPSRSGEMVFP